MRSRLGRAPRLLILAACFAALPIATAVGVDPPPTGLKAEYFANETLTAPAALERIDAQVDFAWGLGAPAPGVPGEEFSVRWTGTVKPRYSEAYTFKTISDDGVRLWVDGQLLIDDWRLHPAAERSGQITLQAGRAYDIKLEYYEHHRQAVARLQWQSASQALEVIPASRLAPPADPTPTPDPDPDPDPNPDPGSDPDDGTDPVQGAPTPPATGTPTMIVPGTTVPQPPTVAPVDTSPLPLPAPPVAGNRFNAEPVSGTVNVRMPGSDYPLPLERGAALPVGTHVDARGGTVTLETAAARGVKKRTQRAKFRGTIFKVRQRRKGHRIVELALLNGDFESCPKGSVGRLDKRVRMAGRKRIRKLWGRGKGRFRTRGRHAAATVRGTTWSVEDTCDATITRVEEGVVEVEDLHRERTVLVRAGESYTAQR
jgi:hypothetical protein